MALPPALALLPCLPTELVSYILQQTHPATLIICKTRASFLSSLKASTLPPPQSQSHQGANPESQQATEISEDTAAEEDESNDSSKQRHSFLIPTLQQLSTSRHTTTAFIPTVSHLRAYLSVTPATPLPSSPPLSKHAPKFDKAGSQAPLLVVYGLVELHKGTSEWSAQGLGSTIAGLVEAGVRAGKRVIIVEEREATDGHADPQADVGYEEVESGHGSGITGGATLMRGRDEGGVWHERLPILNGSLKRIGADTEYGGRTVEVGVVLRRWCRFGRGEWGDGGYV